jgi:hypothetical protein
MMGLSASRLDQLVAQLLGERKVGEMVPVQVPEFDLPEAELHTPEPM